jgi:hypothetical protein
MGGLAQRIAPFVGIGEARFEGRGAFDVLAAANQHLEEQWRGIMEPPRSAWTTPSGTS